MNNERLVLLEKATEFQYFAEASLLLEAHALYFDQVSKRCIAQLKWRNLHAQNVTAVMIELKCYDSFHHEVASVSYQYDRLSVEQGKIFGNRTAVALSDGKTVHYDVQVKAVSYEQGDVWENSGNATGITLPEKQPLTLSNSLMEQYKRDLFQQYNMMISIVCHTQHAAGLWQCVCGSWQKEGEPCLACDTTQSVLEELANPATLEQHLAEYNAGQERLRKEQEQRRIEAEKKAEENRIAREQRQKIAREKAEKEWERQRKALLKKRLIACACVVVLLLIVLGKELFSDQDITGQAQGFQSLVTVQATMDENGVITAIEIDSKDETAGFGQRCADDKDFQAQFIGKTLPLTLGKDIDALSGATVTSTAVVEALNSTVAAEAPEATEAPTAEPTEEPVAVPMELAAEGIHINGQAQGFQSLVTVQATMDENGVITAIEIDSKDETAGFGQRCADDKDFQAQFIGKTLPLILGKDIDALSGATVTSTAVVEALNSSIK